MADKELRVLSRLLLSARHLHALAIRLDPTDTELQEMADTLDEAQQALNTLQALEEEREDEN